MDGIRDAGTSPIGRCIQTLAISLAVLTCAATQVFAQAIPQKNVNAIGPTPVNWLYAGNPRMQQNEAEGVESVVFPGHIAIGFNDYRAVNDPIVGEAFPGIAMSSDGGKTFISGLHPDSLADQPNIGQKGGADPNLEIVPYMMFYNFIAFWRDGSQPPGIYMSRWYEPNRDVGAPFRHLDTLTINTGTTNKFLDKPSFKAATRNPDDGLPDIAVDIPAYADPNNPANSHEAYTLNLPALRLHLCYSIFVGNDNNDGTKIECLASDDGGASWPIKNKLSESVQINQGTTIATRNSGQDVVVAWTRFEDNNETAAVMYAMSTDFGNTFAKAEVVTEFCPFNQSTGLARFRTNALPVIVSAGDDFGVYIAARNDATETCLIRGKGSKPDVPRMSPVSLADDFDSFEEDTDIDGNRIKDGMIRTSRNFSRIMMIRGNGNGKLNWSTPVAVDPRESSPGVRMRGHQFMPACDAAGGIETCSWYDNRLDKVDRIGNMPAAAFVEDLVLHLEPGTPTEEDPNPAVIPTLLPAGAYEQTPPPATLPPNENNIPLRRTLEVFAAQVKNGDVRPYSVNSETYYPTDASDPQLIGSNAVRITRFPVRLKGGEPRQVEWNYPNARLFRKGKASFISDYNTMFAPPLRQRVDGAWVPNQSAPVPGIDLFPSLEPTFRAGWTSNRNVRGKVFYTGCDTWDEDLQMWVAGSGCASPYTDPGTPPMMLLPLQGEDGSNDGPPLTCTIASSMGLPRGPLTRNQNVYTAALVPGISVNVASAIKRPQGQVNTFVLQLLNGGQTNRDVTMSLPIDSHVSFSIEGADTLSAITATVPAGSGNARTVFDFGDPDIHTLDDTIILTVSDASPPYDILAQVPLRRSSLTPLENVQSNDPSDLQDLLFDGEFYELILKREIGLDPNKAALDLENLDLENTYELLDLENLDLENLDLENKVVFLDLENLDLENLDLENSLYTNLDLENLVIKNLDLENLDLENRLMYLDLENLDLENLDLENLDLENLDLENLDLENLDLENLDLENESIFASDVENLDLENLDLENAPAPGDPYTEISWTADSANNTTTGVDIQPVFTQLLATELDNANTTVIMTVRTGYMTGTVASAGLPYCVPQVVVENQIKYAAELTSERIQELVFTGSIVDPDPEIASTPGFVVSPDESTIISLRFINPPTSMSFNEINANVGMGLFSQPGATLNCDIELPGVEREEDCEVDFTEPDLDPPVISLNGSSPAYVDQGSPYVDAGATALDEVDGDVSADIVVSGWNFNTASAGTFTIYYDVTDEVGNVALTVSRTVEVVDAEDPVVTIIGADPVTVEAGGTFTDPGASATDNVGVVGGVSSDASTSVDTSVVGVYTVTYTAVDADGNSGTATRTVNVVDTTPPVVTLTGASTVTLEAGQPYVEDGANASDTGDPGVTVVIGGFVNAAVVGTYTVTYDATDASGNMATQVTRTVFVVDTSPPVIGGIDPPIFTPTAPFVLEPGETTFTIEWPVSAADPNPMLSVYCDIGSPPVRIYPVVTTEGGTIQYTFTYDFEVGETSVTCTAMDQGGNSDSGTFTVTVEDYPEIDTSTLPTMPFYVEANGPAGYTGPTADLWDPITANDRIDGEITAVCTPESDFGFGDNTVTCIATDSAGNESEPVTFTAIVVDTTPPEVTITSDPLVLTTIEATATVSAAELAANIIATDTVDGDIDISNISCTVNGEDSDTLALGLHVDAGSCTATDSAGQTSDSVTFDIEVRFGYDLYINVPNGNKRAGSVIPIDIYYTLPGTNTSVDSSAFPLVVEWFGPYTLNNCGGTNTGIGDGSEALDAGNSNFRYSFSQDITQYSWQTPSGADVDGSYRLVVSPPGANGFEECVNLR